jgi:hypothetical protein
MWVPPFGTGSEKSSTIRTALPPTHTHITTRHDTTRHDTTRHDTTRHDTTPHTHTPTCIHTIKITHTHTHPHTPTHESIHVFFKKKKRTTNDVRTSTNCSNCSKHSTLLEPKDVHSRPKQLYECPPVDCMRDSYLFQSLLPISL